MSAENWLRPRNEVDDLLQVMEQTARTFYQRAIQERVRVRILGDLEDERIPESLREILYKLQEDTRVNTLECADPMTLCLAINYGGRQDILQACKRLVKLVQADPDAMESFTQDDLASLLWTDGLPDPDLVVRTSGEQRLSNFLLWNAAYAELYFADVHWPDFDGRELRKALEWFAGRHRRFGAREATTAPEKTSDSIL
jgi:undecaprenyl diphosphate synthase